MASTLSFAEATAVQQDTSHTYTVAHFPLDWCIGSVPHGGFITSCFMRVAALHFATTLAAQQQPHAITLHLEFLRRTEVGPGQFVVRDVKLGRQTSTLHVTLSQRIGGRAREEVVGYITHSNIAREAGPSYATRWALEPAPPPARPGRFLEDADPEWRALTHRPFASFRRAMDRVRFMIPRRGQRVHGAIDEWLSFSNGERFTNESLGFVSDMFLQVIESHLEVAAGHDWASSGTEDQATRRADARYWYPTVLLNLDVKKALPAEGVEWLFVRVRAKMIKNGRYDLEIVLLDEEGDLVALSHHVCLVLDASRNLAARSGKNAKI